MGVFLNIDHLLQTIRGVMSTVGLQIPAQRAMKLIVNNCGHKDLEPPSVWIKRWAHLVKPNGTVLDVASGLGRHAYYFHQLGHPVTVLDRARADIESITIDVRVCEKVVADIENDVWPLAGRNFDAVVVTNYLWRPLMPTLLASLAVCGVLMYETFAAGNETVGRPSRPDFLLQPGELLEICKDLRIVAFEDGFICGDGGSPRFVQRIVAVQKTLLEQTPARYRLVQPHLSD